MKEPEELMLWSQFEHTGKVEDYLSYLTALRGRTQLSQQVHGEERYADQNGRNRPAGGTLQ